MEYIMITDTKLKVICCEEDLAPYGISADSIEYGDPTSRRFLEEILEYAKSELDFETKRHRVLIQLFPSNDGGCEIFINKLGLISQSAQESEEAPKERQKKETKLHTKVFFFERLNFLLEVCKRLSLGSFCGKSSAFYLDGKGYFLCIELALDDSLEEYKISFIDEYSFILEYGERESAKLRAPYLEEHAKCICRKNAVETLGRI